MRGPWRWAMAGAFVVTGAAMALAADHPAAGDRLVLKDRATPAKRKFRFAAVRDAAIDPRLGADLTVVGASLEVMGAAAGDGATGALDLDASRWVGLGRPRGAKGYRYADRHAAAGIRRVLFKRGRKGGSLTIKGGGDAFPYAITQPQGPIDVRFTVGADVYCSRFQSFTRNEIGRVKAKRAAAPPDCIPFSLLCGNGTIDGVEECDDGNVESGDGCTVSCQLEDPSARCTGVPTVSGTSLRSERVVAGLANPTYLTAPPLDPSRLFVTEQHGVVQVVKNGGLLRAPFLDISTKIACCDERGLLGLAFHPDYESNGRLFVNYTNTAGDTVIARYQVSPDPDRADPDSEVILLTIVQDFTNHNSGQLAFGPDGFLYVGMGDGGSRGDPRGRAQDPASLLGKILRLDVDRVGPPWAAAGNPFIGAAPRDEIWALGLRNPWRFSFDRATGELYVADVGQDLWEEVSVQAADSPGGENYGWNVFEGDGHCFAAAPECTQPDAFVMPVLDYSHADGCSITGGYVYRGCAMPDLHGTYFYGDFCSAFIRTFAGVTGGTAQNRMDRTADLAPGGGLSIDRITSFGQDARGELYVVDRRGEIFRIIPDG